MDSYNQNVDLKVVHEKLRNGDIDMLLFGYTIGAKTPDPPADIWNSNMQLYEIVKAKGGFSLFTLLAEGGEANKKFVIDNIQTLIFPVVEIATYQ